MLGVKFDDFLGKLLRVDLGLAEPGASSPQIDHHYIYILIKLRFLGSQKDELEGASGTE